MRLPDYELVVVGIVLGSRDPVRVPCQHPHRSTQLPGVPELDLLIITCTDQHAWLVGIEVHAPDQGMYEDADVDRWYYVCIV